jgi:hypothetical protein
VAGHRPRGGPWDAGSQHGGPPSALLGRAMQRCQPQADMMIARMRYPLVPDEEPSPLERVLIIADTGSGISWELDKNRWLFINPELTVHVHREATGEWICLDSSTAIAAGGAGLATSALSDQEGPVGVAAQSLLITPHTV